LCDEPTRIIARCFQVVVNRLACNANCSKPEQQHQRIVGRSNELSDGHERSGSNHAGMKT
jgi:hypothetical protein